MSTKPFIFTISNERTDRERIAFYGEVIRDVVTNRSRKNSVNGERETWSVLELHSTNWKFIELEHMQERSLASLVAQLTLFSQVHKLKYRKE